MRRFPFRNATDIILLITMVVVTFFKAIVLLGFFMIGMEDVYTKWDINNPYVNNRFRDCQQITLDTSHTICIPAEWLFEETDGIYKIYDQDNNLWAVGTTFGTECDLFADYAEFLATFVPLQDICVTHEIYSGISYMRGADISKLCVRGTNGEASFFYICLMDTSNPYTVFVLMDDVEQDTSSYDAAEAIMYSFAWPDRTTCAQIT